MMEKPLQAQSIWPHPDVDRSGSANKRDTTKTPRRKTETVQLVETEANTTDRHEEQLDPLSDTTIGYLVRDVHRAFSRSLQARIASHGVSMGQWFFLRALWDEDGLTQRELSQRVGMMEPTTVTALNGMERRGLVERVRNPHDRRKVNIFLTSKGRSLREVLLPTSVEVNDQAVHAIPEQEVATAIMVLRRMIHNLNGHANGNGNGNGSDGVVKGNGGGHHAGDAYLAID